jgi:epoxyqueuosine reductase
LKDAAAGAITPSERRLISESPLAVSFGVPLSSAVVDRLHPPQNSYDLKNYWYHVYQAVNPLINDIEITLTRIIMDSGYTALPVPSSQTVDVQNLYGFFSHKLAAGLAGHGWIGKSCLLITPDRGPRVRWGTILTDARLVSDLPFQGHGCGGCKKCVEVCPAGAFSGRAFSTDEPREARMDASKCLLYLNGQQKRTLGIEACGLCVYVCPYGQKRKRR